MPSPAGPKWRLVYRFTLLEEWQHFRQAYKAIMLPDDDLVLDTCTVNRIFSVLEACAWGAGAGCASLPCSPARLGLQGDHLQACLPLRALPSGPIKHSHTLLYCPLPPPLPHPDDLLYAQPSLCQAAWSHSELHTQPPCMLGVSACQPGRSPAERSGQASC